MSPDSGAPPPFNEARFSRVGVGKDVDV